MNNTVIKSAVILSAIAAVFTIGRLSVADDDAGKVYELRTYTTHEGKLEDLHNRFRDHTNRLFEKHGMELVGYWVPMDDPEASNTLIYVLAHKSRDAAEKSFNAFRNDPEWQEAYRKSHENGPLVKKVESKFMTATDYSPIR